MSRRRILLSGVIAACLTAACVPNAQAEADILEVIPDSALGFVLINNITEFDGKIVQLAGQIGAPPMSPLAMFKMSTGMTAGLNEKAPMAVVAMPSEADAPFPTPMFIGRVDDIDELRKQIAAMDVRKAGGAEPDAEQRTLVGEKDGHALLALPGQDKLLKQVLESKKSIAAEVAGWKKPLGKSDVAAVVMPAGVKVFSNTILAELRKAKEMFKQLDGGNMEQAIAGFEMYEMFVEAAAKETDKVALLGKIDEKGNVFLTKRVSFVPGPGGEAAAAFAEVKPVEADLLAGLPDGPYVAAGGGVFPEKLTEMMLRMSVGVIKAMPELYGIAPEKADKLIALSAESVKGMQGMSMLMGVGKGDDPLYGNMVGFVKVDNSAEFMKHYGKYIDGYNELVGDESAFLTRSEVKNVTIGGKPGLHLSMKIPTTPAAAEVPNYDKLMEAMFGPGEKINVYMATVDETTIAWGYTDKKKLLATLKALETPKKSLSKNKQLAKTKKLLPDGSQWVGYVSPQGSVTFANRMMGVMLKAMKAGGDVDKTGAGGNTLDLGPGLSPSIPQFPKTPPVGFAVKVVDGQLEATLVVPGEVIKAIGEYSAELK